MKIAVIPHPGITFERMFSQWSPFFEEKICQSNSYMLKKELEKRDIELVPMERLEKGEACDAILHFSPFQFEALKRYPNIRHIYIAAEPPVVLPIHSELGDKLLAKYVFNAVIATNHQAVAENIFPVIWPKDFPKELPPKRKISWEEKKLACMFAANKFAVGKHELYTARRQIIKCFEENASGQFDLYGAGWPNQLSVYKGYAEDKYKTSQRYRFSICLSNVAHIKGILDEKIFDAMIAGTVPVYQGIDEIEEYVPAGCFIDYRKFSTPLECLQFLREMTHQEYEQYQGNIHDFISSEKTRTKFSAVNAANAIESACRLSEQKKKRKIYVFQLLKLYNKIYNKVCEYEKVKGVF